MCPELPLPFSTINACIHKQPRGNVLVLCSVFLEYIHNGVHIYIYIYGVFRFCVLHLKLYT